MEINVSNIIIGIISIFICCVPFIISRYNRKKKEKKIFIPLQTLAQQINCTIHEHEFCGDFVIGMDKTKHFVFFVKNIKENISTKVVNLNSIQTCKVVKNTKKNNGNYLIVSDVLLCFVPKNKHDAEILFELYDYNTNLQLSGELQFVEKWKDLIRKHL